MKPSCLFCDKPDKAKFVFNLFVQEKTLFFQSVSTWMMKLLEAKKGTVVKNTSGNSSFQSGDYNAG